MTSSPLLEQVQKMQAVPSVLFDSNECDALLAPLTGLDRLVQELQRCDDSTRQLRILLTSVAESISAESVFVISTSRDGVFEVVSSVPLSEDWCQQLLHQILLGTGGADSGLCQFDSQPMLCDGTRAPRSAAMVQLSKSKNTWAVALSFTAEKNFGSVDLQVMIVARRLLASHTRQLRAVDKLRESLMGLIHCLTAAIDAKDPYTCGHSERVARIAVRVSQEMQLPSPFVSDIYLAGLLHDIGKIGIKDSVLLKPGRLTDEENNLIRQHPVIGDRIIAPISQLKHVRPGVRNHHERFDGNGYPDRLAGVQIPLLARILAVADSCDAMMSARPYRPPMPPHQLETIFQSSAGSQWDPRVVESFMRCRVECYGMAQRGIGQSVAMAIDHAVKIQNDLSWRRSIASSLLRDEPPTTGPH